MRFRRDLRRTAGCSHVRFDVDGSLDVPSEYGACLDGLAALATYFDSNHDRLVPAASESIFHSARLAIDSWHAWQDERALVDSDITASKQARDVEMGAIFEEQLAQEYAAGARVVVWTDNDHLSAKRTAIGGPEAVTFGTVLKRDLGADHAPVAIVAYGRQINWSSVGLASRGPRTSSTRSSNGCISTLGRSCSST